MFMYLAQVATDVVTTPAVVVSDPTVGQKLFAFVQPYLMLLLETVIGAAVGWIALQYQRITGRKMEQSRSDDLDRAATNIAGWLAQQLGDKAASFTDIHMKTANPLVAKALEMFAKRVPDALAHFSIDPATAKGQEEMSKKIEAKLGLITPPPGIVAATAAATQSRGAGLS